MLRAPTHHDHVREEPRYVDTKRHARDNLFDHLAFSPHIALDVYVLKQLHRDATKYENTRANNYYGNQNNDTTKQLLKKLENIYVNL